MPGNIDHGESIYNIIPRSENIYQPPPMYHSKHDSRIPPTGSTFGRVQGSNQEVTNLGGTFPGKVVTKNTHATMGKPVGTSKNSPNSYMKKRATKRVPSLTEVRNEHPDLLQPSKIKPKIKPGIPKLQERPHQAVATPKDFVAANACEVILSATKKLIDGSKDKFNGSGIGKVPKYLQRIKQDIAAEYECVLQAQRREDAKIPPIRMLDDDEKRHLIDDLKTKWDQINALYQKTSHWTTLDTIGKLRRKEKYEAELSQIEKDMEKLNKKNVYVDERASI